VRATDRLTPQTTAALDAACDATATDETTMDTHQVIGLFGFGHNPTACGTVVTTGAL